MFKHEWTFYYLLEHQQILLIYAEIARLSSVTPHPLGCSTPVKVTKQARVAFTRDATIPLFFENVMITIPGFECLLIPSTYTATFTTQKML